MPQVISLLVFFLLVSTAFGGDPSEVERKASAIEQKALAQRRQIRSGHLIVDSKTWQIANEKQSLQFFRTTETWFDGNQIRADVIRPASAPAIMSGPNKRNVNAYSNEKQIFWIENKQEPIVVQVTDRDTNAKQRLDVVHPRLLGMVPVASPNLTEFNLESFIARADRTELSLKDNLRNGQNCNLITYRLKNSVLVRAWYSPQHDGSLVQIEIDYYITEGRLRESVESQLIWVKSARLWYPQLCVYKRFLEDNLVGEERAESKTIELDTQIDPVVFSLSGLGITPGTNVQFSPEGDTKMWDGNALVPVVNVRPDMLAKVPPGATSYNWLYVNLALLLATFVVFNIVRYVLKYKRKTHNP